MQSAAHHKDMHRPNDGLGPLRRTHSMDPWKDQSLESFDS
jgi:hypothetical protein